MSILPKLDDVSRQGANREYLHYDEECQGEYPGLFEFLTKVLVEGHPRPASRLVVYYEEDKACLLLTDPHTCQILFHHDDSFHEALTSLEKRLQAGTTDWRKDKKSRYTR